MMLIIKYQKLICVYHLNYILDRKEWELNSDTMFKRTNFEKFV